MAAPSSVFTQSMQYKITYMLLLWSVSRQMLQTRPKLTK